MKGQNGHVTLFWENGWTDLEKFGIILKVRMSCTFSMDWILHTLQSQIQDMLGIKDMLWIFYSNKEKHVGNKRHDVKKTSEIKKNMLGIKDIMWKKFLKLRKSCLKNREKHVGTNRHDMKKTSEINKNMLGIKDMMWKKSSEIKKNMLGIKDIMWSLK